MILARQAHHMLAIAGHGNTVWEAVRGCLVQGVECELQQRIMNAADEHSQQLSSIAYNTVSDIYRIIGMGPVVLTAKNILGGSGEMYRYRASTTGTNSAQINYFWSAEREKNNCQLER